MAKYYKSFCVLYIISSFQLISSQDSLMLNTIPEVKQYLNGEWSLLRAWNSWGLDFPSEDEENSYDLIFDDYDPNIDSIKYIIKINDTLRNEGIIGFAEAENWWLFKSLPCILNPETFSPSDFGFDKKVISDSLGIGVPQTSSFFCAKYVKRDVSSSVNLHENSNLIKVRTNPILDNRICLIYEKVTPVKSITLYDKQGRVVYRSSDFKECIEIPFLNIGVYFLNVKTPLNSFVFKIVKAH